MEKVSSPLDKQGVIWYSIDVEGIENRKRKGKGKLMETIEEVLEKKKIVRDAKARRVLNTAPDKDSGITLQELEAGVPIEKLEGLDVPVYMYGGQVTIHGIFQDDVGKNMRVAGYKSVFKNGNGSIGVRYVAVDAGKKKRIETILRVAKMGWYGCMNSKGFEVVHRFASAAEAKAAYLTVPENYIGNKYIARSMYGSFYVVLEIGAIYEKDVEKFIFDLIGLDGEGIKELEEKKKKEDAEKEAAYQKRCADSRILQAEQKLVSESFCAKMTEELAKVYPKAVLNKTKGVYAYAFASSFNPDKQGVMLFTMKKGGFGRTLRSAVFVKEIKDIPGAVFPVKYKVLEDETFAKLQKLDVFLVG